MVAPFAIRHSHLRLRLHCAEYGVSINWKEVCKFLSGAFFVSSGVLFYLYLAGSPVPVLGAHLEVTPTVNGVRAAVHAVLFVVFFYLGYIRK
jgi:hypothetical protein